MSATSENALAKFERLLKETSKLLEHRRGNMKTSIESLLAEAKPHLERIERNELLTAPRFNVFNALGVVRKEVIQSRFLAYLLSPLEQHKQDAKFLNAFLIQIGVAPIVESEWARVKVYPEYPLDEYGRIDILITAPELLVAIENKVDAGEGIDQIRRYQEWMGLEKNKQNKKTLVFLTPDGRESKTANPKSIFIPFLLSYAELAEIFSPLIHTIIPCPVRAVIEQYITACRLISLGEIAMTTPDNELIALLTQPDNLKPALEIEQQMTLARQNIGEYFCAEVLGFIQELLKKESITNWSAEKCGPCEIKISPYHKSNYCLTAQSIFSNDIKSGKIAWYYSDPPHDKGPLPEISNLIKLMRSDGLGNKGWWPNWMCI